MAAKKPSRRQQVAAGLLGIMLGLCIAAVAVIHISRPGFRLDPVVGVVGGIAFALVGAVLLAPEGKKKLRAWFGALMVTSIAILFDWLAFGPGEHHVASNLSNSNLGVRVHFWEAPGRVMLASGAVLFTLMAAWAWTRRTLWKRARA
jgi:hypothetical protein